MADFPHDEGYKALFSHPELVRSLLTGFVDEEFVSGLDWGSLRLVSPDYISSDFHERQNDIIWEVSFRGSRAYIFLMIEFQSSKDERMALRMLTYTGLLWESLIKNGYIKPGDKLPPVFPIVLYNGKAPWNVALELSGLIDALAPGLACWEPEYRYYIIDEKRIAPEILSQVKGEAGYVVGVEQANSGEKILAIAISYYNQAEVEKPVRETMLDWMNRKLRHIAPGWQAEQEDDMLAELIRKHTQPYID